MSFDSPISRRTALQALAGGAMLAAGWPASASEARIDKLIGEAHALPAIGQRIDFISRALLGTRYQGYTLIGGPRSPEKFVVRDDAFDCVTFCEAALAAAIARDAKAYAASLRAIRYYKGVVAWRERNHYFWEWSEHNIENKTCRAIDMVGAIEIHKTVYWHKALGRRHFTMRVIPRAVFLANRNQLATGDVVGFVTSRPNLDYFHTGFVAFGPKREFLLRNASQIHGRVVDESMERFVALWGVQYVTLLRPLEPPAVA